MSDFSENSSHNLTLIKRNKLNVTGIQSVDSYDDYSISATTIEGEQLYIDGDGISLMDVNLENKCFEASGNFISIQYSSERSKVRSGLFSRLFER